MKKTFTAYCIVSIVFLSMACQRVMEEDFMPEKPVGGYTLTALLEGSEDTKTHLSEADAQGIYYPFWSKGDALALYADGINRPDTYTLVEGDGTVKGSFTGKLFGSRMVALYPASGRTEEGLQGEVLTLELPAQQEYTPGSFGKDTYPMLAVTTSGELAFKNLCSVLKLSLTGEEYIRSITFRAADSKMAVSGKATVRTDFSSVPELVMAEGGSNEVTLKCGSVELSPSQPTEFFIVIPSGTYRGGFTVEIETYHGTVTRSTSADITFERSQFRSIPTFVCEGGDSAQIPPHNQIWYRTKHNEVMNFSNADFDVNLVSNTYESNMGILEFDGPVKEIRTGALYPQYLNELQDVYLPDCVERIEDYGICNSNMSSFRTPNHLSYISNRAFYGCDSLTHFYGQWASKDGKCIVLKDGTLGVCIPDQETLEIPLGVISIPDYFTEPYRYNNHVRHLILPEGLIYIGRSNFRQWLSLEDITFPSTLSHIGSNSFYSCYNLREVAFPEGITRIESFCFNGCDLLESITLPVSLEQLGVGSFEGCPIIRELKGASRFIMASDYLITYDPFGNANLEVFAGKDSYAAIIPEGIHIISSSPAFVNCLNLKSIEFPSSLGWIYEEGWMWNCPNVEFFYGLNVSDDHHCLVLQNNLCAVTPVCPSDYSVPDGLGVTGIKSCAFRGNTSIKQLTLPNEITNISSLKQMLNLVSVRLPAALQSLGDDPFEGNLSLETVFLRSSRPPSVNFGDSDLCKWGTDNLVIYVPKGFEEQYKQAPGWSKYADRIQGYVYDDLPDYYLSTDYSRDGEVTTLQAASNGQGINVVLMGDAYSDRQIADGTYAAVMRQMMEAFFSEEPYTSYRDLFNVYSVAVVSAMEGYERDGQALGTWFGDGTHVGGNDARCMEYARKAVPESELDNTVIIVAMNRDYYAGTCYMYNSFDGDYGNGLSVAYFPASSDTETFNALVLHEAGGHGFPKLGDEYAYEGSISQEEKESYESMSPYGWWKNIDFTSDPDQVKWARFLKDARYSNDGLGVFEGGATYAYGVWRPTEYSIMRYNTGGFNAPSREAIWYRMHKLAYGNNWNYDYEEFVAYDAKNRAGSAAQSPARSPNYVERRREPTHPPVVMGRRWNDPLPRKQEAPRREESRLMAPDKLPGQVKTR